MTWGCAPNLGCTCFRNVQAKKCSVLLGFGQGCPSKAARYREGQVELTFNTLMFWDSFFLILVRLIFMSRFFSRVAEEKIKAVGGACILTAQWSLCLSCQDYPSINLKSCTLCFNWATLVSDKMVKIGLQLKAFLENCTCLTPEGEDFRLATERCLSV